MTTSSLAPHRVVAHLVAVSLSLGVMAACGDDGEAVDGAGGGSTGTEATTGSDTSSTTSTSSAGDGGATSTSTATTGGDGGGGGTTSAGGGAPTCDGARSGAPCDVEGTRCEELTGQGLCEEGLPRITSCVDGLWEVWSAISCGAFVPSDACTVPGRYLVEPSGAFEPESDAWLADEHGEAFEVTFEVRDDGRLYASAGRGWIDADPCEVSVGWTLEEECEDVEGESFCTMIDRTLELVMTPEPATGTVSLVCSGECDGAVSAPVTATRL